MKINSIVPFRLQSNFKKQNNALSLKTVCEKTDSVSFKGDFNYNYINKKGAQIRQKAAEIRSYARNIELEAVNQQTQAAWLKDCAIYEFERAAISRGGIIKHPWGDKDVEVIKNEAVDGISMPSKIAKYNTDGEVDFEAEFDEGRLTRIFMRNFDETKNIYEFNKENGKLQKVISRKTPTSFDEEFAFDIFSTELISYKQGYQLCDDGKKTTAEIMTFALDENNKPELTYYQKNRVQYLDSILEVQDTYFFDDYENFSFQEGYKKQQNGEIVQGETFVLNNFGVQEYDKGFKQLEDGTKIYLPKMKASENHPVIEVLDFGYTQKPDGEIERNNYFEMPGGIYHMILRMFGFLGE